MQESGMEQIWNGDATNNCENEKQLPLSSIHSSVCWVASAFLVSIMMPADLFFNTLQQLTSSSTSMLTLRKSFRKDGSVIILRRVSTLHGTIWCSNSVFCEYDSRTATGTDTNFRCECVSLWKCNFSMYLFLAPWMLSYVFLIFFPSAFFNHLFFFYFYAESFLFWPVVFVCRLILCHSTSGPQERVWVGLCFFSLSYLCIPFSLFDGDYFALFFFILSMSVLYFPCFVCGSSFSLSLFFSISIRQLFIPCNITIFLCHWCEIDLFIIKVFALD